MSMYPGHRGMPPTGAARLNELLEQIRGEFDTQVRLNETFEAQSESGHWSQYGAAILTWLL
jgi:general transcriptional corepressor TUP1